MADTREDLPGEWFEIETSYDFQHKMWRNGATGNVLSVEDHAGPFAPDTNPPPIDVLLLDQDFEENKEPLEWLGEKLDEPGEAMRRALDFMSEAPGSE